MRLLTCSFTLAVLFLAACAPELEPGSESGSQAIINGVAASDYPEACNIDMADAACSAALIAPKLILTAGHCVYGETMTSARCPFHPDSTVRSRNIRVKPNGVPHPSYNTYNITYDIGVVLLDESIVLPDYPTIAQTAPAVGTDVVRVGRILNNQLTYSMYKRTGTISRRSAQDLLIDSNTALQLGDSGGPDFLTTRHEIVGVNSWVSSPCSTCAPTTEALMRTDIVYAWIQQQIQNSGGMTGCVITGCQTGYRCDTATGTCVQGCSITGCPIGTQCRTSTQVCVPACTVTGCGAGDKCDTTTNQCIPGCAKSGCPAGYRCNATSQNCEPGCSLQGCPSTQRCDTATGLCVDGCSVTGCPAQMACQLTTQTCVPGCSQTGCTSGLRCDPRNQQCVKGCSVTGCGTGTRCDRATELCVDGCTRTGCGATQRCDAISELCVDGCSVTGCPAGEECSPASQTCVAPGCQVTGCPNGQTCDSASGQCRPTTGGPPPNLTGDGGTGLGATGGCGCAASGTSAACLALVPAFWALRRRRN